MAENLRFKAPGPGLTRDLKDCVLASDYDEAIGERNRLIESLRAADAELALLKGQFAALRVRAEALSLEANLYHEAMGALRATRLAHGACLPRERRACTHCAGQERLDALQKAYRGRRIILAGTRGAHRVGEAPPLELACVAGPMTGQTR